MGLFENPFVSLLLTCRFIVGYTDAWTNSLYNDIWLFVEDTNLQYLNFKILQ